MKRNEIKAGMELYYDRSTTWQAGTYSHGEKAVVADDKRYRINKQAWGSRDETYTEDPKGSAVLVDLHRRWGHGEVRVVRTAVLAAHLRGPWEKLHAEITALREERRQSAERADVERKTLNERADAAKARAAAGGYKVTVSHAYSGSGATCIEMTVEEFERLLGAAGVAAGNRTDG